MESRHSASRFAGLRMVIALVSDAITGRRQRVGARWHRRH
jgi:hypothetical protein